MERGLVVLLQALKDAALGPPPFPRPAAAGHPAPPAPDVETPPAPGGPLLAPSHPAARPDWSEWGEAEAERECGDFATRNPPRREDAKWTSPSNLPPEDSSPSPRSAPPSCCTAATGTPSCARRRCARCAQQRALRRRCHQRPRQRRQRMRHCDSGVQHVAAPRHQQGRSAHGGRRVGRFKRCCAALRARARLAVGCASARLWCADVDISTQRAPSAA